MKRAFISILLFFWGLHIAFPMLYYSYYGFFTIYSNISSPEALQKAFWMNTATIFGTVAVLIALPDKKEKIQPIYYSLTSLFYLVFLYSLIYLISIKGFTGILSGAAKGTVFGYLNKFVDMGVIFLVIIGYQKNKYSIITMLLLFLIITTVFGSRSCIIAIILSTMIIFPMFTNYSIYKNKIYIFIIIFTALSPLMFYYGTLSRGINVDRNLLSRQIVGRISSLELSMIPINCKDNNISGCNLDMFYEKYNPVRQILQSIDTMYPGNIWVTDVLPSQYYRVAFLGWNEEKAKSFYTSMNMTLPVYFYMYTNETIASILSIITLVCYYLVWMRFRKNIYIFLGMILTLYFMLQYFDFVMLYYQFFIYILTIATVQLFINVKKYLVMISKTR